MEKIKPQEKEFLLSILAKNPEDRTKDEIKKAAIFLSEHYQYFIKLKSNKDFGFQKIEKITKFVKLETHNQKEIIIKLGELGDKFYILLEGSVAVYKPVYKERNLTPIEFSNMLVKIRDVDLDKSKYERLIEKNSHLKCRIKDIEKMTIKPNYMFYKVKIFWEELERIGEFKEGFSFGEMALIKKTSRNATIKTTSKSIFLTIEKKDYNKAIRELRERKISNDMEKFTNSYPIFKMLYREKILEILNNFTKITLYKSDSLFQQNDDSENVYFLNNGTINLSFNISFSWLNDYLKYFHNYSGNLLFYLINRKPKKFSELVDIFDAARKDMRQLDYLSHDNEEINEFFKWQKCNEKINEGNLIGIKYEEDKLNNSNNVYSINLKNVFSYDMIGLEDSLECKRRLFTAKCISDHAELNCIKVFDLLKILCNLEEDSLYDFLSYTLKRKDILKNQVINKIKLLEKQILFSLSNKYDILKGDSNNLKKEEDKNRIISVIKMKGFKSKIQDILDKDLLLPTPSQLTKIPKKVRMKYIYNSTEKDLMNKYKKDLHTLKKIYKLSSSNPHILKYKNKKELSKKDVIKVLSNSYTNIKSNNYTSLNKRKKYGFEKDSSLILKNNFFNKSNNNNCQISQKNNFIKVYLPSTPSTNRDNRDNIGNKDNIDNSKDKDKILYTKILPKPNVTSSSIKLKKIALTNRILSTYTSPLKDLSSTFVDSADDNKKLLKSILDSKNKLNYKMPKLIKNNNTRILNYSRDNEKDNKNKKECEIIFYDKIRNQTKGFILDNKFNKQFAQELSKFKPCHYQTFYNK